MWYFCAPVVLVFSHPWHPNSQPVNFASLTVLLGQLLPRIVLALNFLNDQCDLWKQIQSHGFQKGLNLEAEILKCHSAFVSLNKISQALSPLWPLVPLLWSDFSIYSDTVIVPLTLFECATTGHIIILLRANKNRTLLVPSFFSTSHLCL